MSSPFLAALALAKPADSVPLPDGKYDVKIVSAEVKAGNTVDRVLRLDLTTVGGRFEGRRQVKNQPLTANGAPYVAALLEATGNTEIATNTALGQAFETGQESAMRLFVGKTFRVSRSTKSDGSVTMDILAAEADAPAAAV